MKYKHKTAVIYAILAAVLYAISSPFSKLLLKKIPATMLAALLYLGAGIGLILVGYVQKKIAIDEIGGVATDKKRTSIHRVNGSFRYSSSNIFNGWANNDNSCKCITFKQF